MDDGTIRDDYVSFETAKLLKERGFPQEYDRYHSLVYNEEDYKDEYEVQRMVLETRIVKAGTLSSYPIGVPEPKCYCPTLQMTMKWLRKVHEIFIRPNISFLYPIRYYCEIFCYGDNLKTQQDVTTEKFESPEEACEEAIRYCLENLI